MTSFCLVVTSRGRPDSWARLRKALALHTVDQLDIWLVLDDDDPTVTDYEAFGATVMVGPRRGHVGSLNEHCVAAASIYDIVGQMGDDHLPRTVGWDRHIRAALTTPGIAYGNDLLQGENLPTAVFMHSAVIQATGRFAPEGLWHLYADNYWRDLGAGAGCLHYLPDVIIEHLHPVAQKAGWDATYEESNASAVDQADAAVWAAFQATELAADIAKVKAAL